MKRTTWSVGACAAALLALGPAASQPAAPAARGRAVAPGPAAAPGAFAEESGVQRFLAAQTEAAKAAARKKDYAAAEKAWTAVLEMDPASVPALEGLADVARGREDLDAEIFWRTEMQDEIRRAIAGGDRTREKLLPKLAARLKELDPSYGQADTLLEEYSAAQAALGETYLAESFYACAQLCWQRRLELCLPGSPEASAARDALLRISKEGGDEVASHFDPIALAGEKDEAWIQAFDKKSATWSDAARFDTPHYRIRTNAGWRMGTQTAAVMERVHAFYREVWGIAPDPPPDPLPEGLRELSISPIDVNIYDDRAEYLKKSGAPEWSGGVFTGDAVSTYDHSDGGKSTAATMGTLFHEASHQFMAVAVGGAPSFVNEGIASLFEGIEILSNGTIRRDLPVGHYLTPLADALETGKALPLKSIFNALENAPEQYQYRWGVMYFLRNYVDAEGNYVYRDRLQEYIWEFKKGTLGDMAEHFQEFVLEPVGVPGLLTFAEFEQVWSQWIVDLAAELKLADKRLDEYRSKGKMALLKEAPEDALRFYERALDIDPDDAESIHGVAQASELLGKADRATSNYRRFIDLADEADKRRKEAQVKLAVLDPHDRESADARRALAGGIAGLAIAYDKAGLPRMAMRCGKQVLRVDPFEPGSRALVTRLERDTGLTVDRWQRLFNGFDLDGWYGFEGGRESFYVLDGQLMSDSSRAAATTPAAGAGGAGGAGTRAGGEPEGGAALYQALMVDRKVDGDWSLEARIECKPDWQIAGLCFGVKDVEHYEAIVLRRTGDGINNVDFGSFDGTWSFRGDGSVKATYDAAKGVTLRVDVRGRQVSVMVDGQPVKPIVGGKSLPSMKYPLAALRGDIGLLASRGVTRFSDVRLLSRGAR